jgi:enoyl-CoA hydratase/carnithine racemase
MSEDIFDVIRAASARVAANARFVRIDDTGVAALVDELARMPAADPDFDPGHHRVGDDDATLAFVFTLNAINFGSGWFPFLSKRPGLSGYMTIATNLREHFLRAGPWSADALRALTAAECADVLEQDLTVAEVGELMALYATAWNDLGRFVAERYDGRFSRVVESAAGSAAALVRTLGDISFYRDVARYAGFEVPFYKRAQITAADLAVAFDQRGHGEFEDLDRLTIFADNLVPHVLRRKGVLVYEPVLARRIDAEELLTPGSPEEVEIRASALHAVERCVAGLADAGKPMTAQQVDYLMWTHGQSPEMKATPRHRARSTYY